MKLYYNTEKEPIKMPEYGRYILEMAEGLQKIEDRDKRSAQAAALIRAMEILGGQNHVQDRENYEHKLWDHLYLMAGPGLDIDAPWPAPEEAQFTTRPVPLPMKDQRIRAAHYGRNIEKIIDLLCEEPESETKNSLYRALAVYMRQQYLIWNKDNVADETIFRDIEKLSGGRLKTPEGMQLEKISSDANFSRPNIGMNAGFRKKNKGRKK